MQGEEKENIVVMAEGEGATALQVLGMTIQSLGAHILTEVAPKLTELAQRATEKTKTKAVPQTVTSICNGARAFGPMALLHMQRSTADKMRAIQTLYTMTKPQYQEMDLVIKSLSDKSTTKAEKLEDLRLTLCVAVDSLAEDLKMLIMALDESCIDIADSTLSGLKLFLDLAEHYGGDETFLVKPDPQVVQFLRQVQETHRVPQVCPVHLPASSSSSKK